jgi:hypothetical protein
MERRPDSAKYIGYTAHTGMGVALAKIGLLFIDYYMIK